MINIPRIFPATQEATAEKTKKEEEKVIKLSQDGMLVGEEEKKEGAVLFVTDPSTGEVMVVPV